MSQFSKDHGLRVQVGKQPHPMQQNHFVEWIFVLTRLGEVYCKLAPR